MRNTSPADRGAPVVVEAATAVADCRDGFGAGAVADPGIALLLAVGGMIGATFPGTAFVAIFAGSGGAAAGFTVSAGFLAAVTPVVLGLFPSADRVPICRKICRNRTPPDP